MFFGLSCVVLSTIILPLQRLLVRNSKRQQELARHTVKQAISLFIGLMKWCGVFNFRFPAAEQLQHQRGKIIIANHPCLIDVLALITIVPKANCVVKAHLWKNPFMRGVMRSTGYISNGEVTGLMEDCRASLADGNNLIIFPEGTRSTPGKPIVFQRGAANIALRTDSDFVAVQIDCTPITLIKDSPWYNAPAQKPTLTIQWLGEISAAAYRAEPQLTLASRQLTEFLNHYFLNAGSN